MPILSGGTPTGLPFPPTGLTVVQTILLLAGDQLQDMTGTKWPPDRLLPYLNLGILEIVILIPEAYPVTQNITLVAGPIQSLPVTALQALDFVCNMGAGGLTPGKAITHLNKDQVDRVYPGWMAHTAADVVKFAIDDSKDPRTFYVFPPQSNPAVQKIRVVLSFPPAEIADTDTVVILLITDSACVESNGTYALIFSGGGGSGAVGTYTIASNVITTVALTSAGTGYTSAPSVATQSGGGEILASMITQTFPLDDSYKPAIVDYVIYRALVEETTIPNALQKAQIFYQKFMADLGLKSNAEKAVEEKGK